jgi:hypothetical protein
MDTRALYKQDYEAQMNGRSPDVAEESAPRPAAGADIEIAAADAPNVGPDENTTISVP